MGSSRRQWQYDTFIRPKVKRGPSLYAIHPCMLEIHEQGYEIDHVQAN